MFKSEIQREIEEIIKDGKYKGVNSEIIASNIIHVLEKCYDLKVENLERNDRPWIG
jgi:hypothetical protein